MDSKITIIRDNNGKVLGTKRQNPTTKPVIKKPLTVGGKQVFNISELLRKCRNGEILTPKEEEVLNQFWTSKYYGLKPHKEKNVDRSEVIFNKGQTEKQYITASDQYFQQQEKIRQIENSVSTKSTGYRPLDNNPKGGFERAMEKMHQLGETKAELTEKSAKITKKFAKILEFCKKYGKSIKA